MDLAEVESVMAGLAKLESLVDEEMPTMPAKAADVPAPGRPTVIKDGQFQDIDAFHRGMGTATIYRGADGSRLLRLEDFLVTNGPELHVVLSPYGGPREAGGRLQAPGWIDLGKLKGNIGNQNYTIPDDVDLGIQKPSRSGANPST